MKPPKLKLPHTLILIYVMVVLTVVATWLIPGGEYQRVERDGRSVPVAGSYHRVDSAPQGLGGLFVSPARGFVAAAMIIAIVFIFGGAFNVIQQTGAIAGVIHNLSLTFGGSKALRVLFIPVVMILFSLGGAIFGMCEETMPFILIIVPLALSLGYDSLVGTAIPFLGAAAGFGGAFSTPSPWESPRALPVFLYTRACPTGLLCGPSPPPSPSPLSCGMPPGSTGTPNYLLSMTWTARNGRSFTSQQGEERRSNGPPHGHPAHIPGRHCSPGGGYPEIQIWYIEEIAALFFAMGLICGFAGGLNSDSIAKAYMAGAKDMINPVLIIACAREILIIALDGRVLDTILFYLATFISHFPPLVTAWSMFLVQCVINFVLSIRAPARQPLPYPSWRP